MYISKKSTKRFCSTDCQNIWQRNNTGFKNKRFRGGYVSCEMCAREFLVGKYIYESDRHHFCSSDCRKNWYSSIWSQSEAWRLESKERAVRILSDNKSKTQTKPQVAVNNMLEELGISYRNEEPYKYYSLDNYLVDYNLVIEVMGDYWHASPLKYPKSVNDKQMHIISRDKAKHTYIKNQHQLEILYLWEADILIRPSVCKNLVLKYIETGGVLPNYHSFNYHISNQHIELNDKIETPYQERNQKTAC